MRTWVVVKIRVPFWVPILIRHLLFRVPKKGLISTTTHKYLCLHTYIKSLGCRFGACINVLLLLPKVANEDSIPKR